MRAWVGSWMFAAGASLMTYAVVLQGRCTYRQARERIRVLLARMQRVQDLQDESALLKEVWAAKLRGEEI